MGFWRRLFGVGDDPAAPPPPEISAAQREPADFVDLTFALEREQNPRKFVARGRHRGRSVAFAFSLGA
ncbi:MAG: hypothetical protein HZA52_05940 [Planctomycetes bacterium]|nr:hypothetical protein [Planctomycetota bacterium]